MFCLVSFVLLLVPPARLRLDNGLTVRVFLLFGSGLEWDLPV